MESHLGPAAVHYHRRLEFTARDGVSPVGEGRAFTRRTLSGWHLAPSVLGDDAQLVVSELLTNATRYTAGPLALDLDLNGPCLRITVTDPRSGTALPHPGTHRPTRVGGHGLFIVDRLALSWGALPDGGGKAVWAELLVPSGRPPPSPCSPAAASTEEQPRRAFGTGLGPPGPGSTGAHPPHFSAAPVRPVSGSSDPARQKRNPGSYLWYVG
ncbi:ATP-binding protein [Kitasatospora sp. NPDC002551]|uniref:ATP-binding protein n=1 Tax=Kitasatospora sp. NPDC002551 TaxID=3154539 RepID=UPI00332C40FB